MVVWRKATWAALLISLLIHGVALSFAGWRWAGFKQVAAVSVPSLRLNLKNAPKPVQAESPATVYGDFFSPVFAQGETFGMGAFTTPNGTNVMAGVAPKDASADGKHEPVVAATSEQIANADAAIKPQPQQDKRFLPASAVDREALPASVPDFSKLTGTEVPNGTIRLRLFIDEAGQVVEVRPDLSDGRHVEGEYASVEAMFKATRFIPAIKNRVDVASFLDIEIDVTELARPVP